MKRDFLNSIFLHLFVAIIGGIIYLYWDPKIPIETHAISLALVSKQQIYSQQSYKPLNVPSVNYKDNLNNSATKQKTVEKSKEQVVDKSIDDKKNSKDTGIHHDSSEVNNPATQDHTVKSDESTEHALEKAKFTENLLSGLEQESLTAEEIKVIQDQIRSCWYGQNSYYADDMQIELVLTMNDDATIKNIEIIDKQEYDSATKRSILAQVLRALKDPRCKQLKISNHSYSKWRIIHLIFNKSSK